MVAEINSSGGESSSDDGIISASSRFEDDSTWESSSEEEEESDDDENVVLVDLQHQQDDDSSSSSSSSYDDGSSFNSTVQGRDEEEELTKLTRTEARHVEQWRKIYLAILAITGVVTIILLAAACAVFAAQKSNAAEPTSSSALMIIIIITVILLLIFLLSLAFLFFFMFDLAWRRNYRVLFDHAVSINKVISTLFPSTVRKRLFPTNKDNDKDKKIGGAAPFSQSFSTTFAVGRDQMLEQMRGVLSNFAKGKSNFFGCSDDATSTGGGGGAAEEEDDLLMMEGGEQHQHQRSPPIADYFTDTTILFADIVGFTAWSSIREPVHVFTLLETLYHAFDAIAEKRGVFKVETVGDCYVAVTGLPDPRPDHAVALCRFAHDCMKTMHEVLPKLEVELGPDTGDLSMRFGLHSGSVTAGVLRGKRSRFQLFGDTMNTASRMETTSTRGRIQISEDTKELLVQAGKKRWVTKRDELVFAKGKGEMQTYWLEIKGRKKSKNNNNQESAPTKKDDAMHVVDQVVTKLLNEKMYRLINWTCDVLRKLLLRLQMHRASLMGAQLLQEEDEKSPGNLIFTRDNNQTILDEMSDMIEFPNVLVDNSSKDGMPVLPNQVKLDPDADIQLQTFVTEIASLYNADNEYHNFEHAASVIMAAGKMLSRVVVPDAESGLYRSSSSRRLKKQLGKMKAYHDDLKAASSMSLRKSSNSIKSVGTTAAAAAAVYSPGITSDPLTVFAFVFSALILDVAHTGVPNEQLAVEEPHTAATYKYESVAEQRSVDIAWTLLMDNDDYAALRKAIYSTEAEMHRFRKLVVNSVLASDVASDVGKARNDARWEHAFGPRASINKSRDLRNMRTTVIIEHIMQAADAAHTMQPWAVYLRWSRNSYKEANRAYEEARGGDKHPADDWYERELEFFDRHVLPLTKKLNGCLVFGASGIEFLKYAQQNRREWESQGRRLVAEMSGRPELKDKPPPKVSISNQGKETEQLAMGATPKLPAEQGNSLSSKPSQLQNDKSCDPRVAPEPAPIPASTDATVNESEGGTSSTAASTTSAPAAAVQKKMERGAVTVADDETTPVNGSKNGVSSSSRGKPRKPPTPKTRRPQQPPAPRTTPDNIRRQLFPNTPSTDEKDFFL